MKILSFGAGVNSTAILVLHADGKYNIDAVIFADTFCEHPETYEHIFKTVIPLCERLGLPFHSVSRGNLFEEYWDKNIIPYRMFRSCTDKFKMRPIREFVKENYGEDVIYVLGIDYGEKHRVEKYIGGNFEFPLIDMQLDREACKRIIKNFGLKVPIKSGCFFCPFTKKKGWIGLLKNHRKLFLEAEKFEKNSRAYPKYTLTNKPLQKIREAIDNQQTLCGWIDGEGERCVFCHD